MKSLKIVLASLLLVAGGITVSSFAVESYNSKAFALKCYTYVITDKDNITFGSADQITELVVKNEGFWAVSAHTPSTISTICDPTNFLCAICFDDSKYTLTQALTAVWNYYNTNHTFTSGLDIDPLTGATDVLRVYIRDVNDTNPNQ
ncbi:hypothetical protein [Pseudobacter ginsenosidimutans]|uniref:Uncharacterized protein n=1 Tax=Pseudobacter ginsenosidimutans TaxID=661488 RepID=A0A4Q7MQJ4_9BACT|nr:hypothetical protein [Pseudobacter ginsenosidimutans]QEC40305.1 hypothetical protein FSB84_00840 [Pseudobacter ginsenosidimutans]RZS69092.1 hypothetical protein EV199_4917 [Pseudobacter ginsenosidimutans]